MYREAVDEIDDAMLELLEARLDLSKKIGGYKKANGLKPFQKDRWNSLLEKIIENGEEHGLDKEYIESIWEIIHDKSIEVQK
jgi:chorismate mutase